MNQDFKDSTSAAIRRYVHARIDAAVCEQKMTIDVLSSHSGVGIRRVGDILLNSLAPTVDEAAMMFIALGIPLDDLVEHVKALPYFKRKGGDITYYGGPAGGNMAEGR